MIIERVYCPANEQSNCLNAIADERAKQADVAAFYADCIRADAIAKYQGKPRCDWKAINRAICERWPKGLEWVKKMAWKIVKGKGGNS